MALIPSFFGGRRSNIFDPFSLDIFDPFEGFGAVTNAPSWGRETAAVANPRVSWKETPEPHVIKVDLPGLKKEERRAEQGAGGEDGQVAPRGEEQRQVRPPVQAAGERDNGPVNTAMENGVLTVTEPKEERKKPEVKAIDISG
ncbi:hypothetical protein RJ639_026363 [Escallonia herrerae]|uniref:SHSP domain-containing protein n=1 Tax=Escallonia herrerae TaxID=1293975 RepID=A0AA88RUE5_9ASTE|nr:hypothetical protein RJ639_026363 [Escallonia herrerae]